MRKPIQYSCRVKLSNCMNKKLFEEGMRLEKAGELEGAGKLYQRVFDADRGSQEVVGRLLVVYRRLKEHRKELQVIEAALGAVAQRDKAARDRWISEHPGAAKLGKEVLRTLGGESLTAYGTDPLVEKLLKRKGVLEKKKGVKRPVGKKAAGEKERLAREREASKRQKEREAQKAARLAEKKAAAELGRMEAEAKRAAAEAKRKEAQAKRAAAQAKAYPLLFVVSLKYLVPMVRIKAAMEKHVAFLDKHFAAGDFLVAGQQAPETGEVIIVRGRNMVAVERIMKQDPFVKGKLAGVVNIVEFLASKVDKRMKSLV